MTDTIIDPAPLHLADLTAVQALRFGEICALYLEDGQRAPLDHEGYLFDDAIEYVLEAEEVEA